MMTRMPRCALLKAVKVSLAQSFSKGPGIYTVTIAHSDATNSKPGSVLIDPRSTDVQEDMYSYVTVADDQTFKGKGTTKIEES